MNVDELLAAVNSGNSDVLMRGLLSGPNGQDRDKALNYGLLTAGLGLLGGKNIGNAGLLGLQTGMGAMDDAQKRNMQALAIIPQIQKNSLEAQKAKTVADFYSTQNQQQFIEGAIPQPSAELGGGPGREGQLNLEKMLRAGASRGVIDPEKLMLHTGQLANARAQQDQAKATLQQQADLARERMEQNAALARERIASTESQKEQDRLLRELLGGNRQRASFQDIVDPADPNRIIKVDPEKFDETKYLAGDRTGVLGASGKTQAIVAKEEKQSSAKESLKSELDNLRASFDTLKSSGGVTSSASGTLDNVLASIRSSTPGQIAGRVVGTKDQDARNSIQSARLRLLNDIKNATGMSAQSLNSNIELKTWLDSLTNLSNSYESNMAIIDAIEEKYVKGGGARAATQPSGAMPKISNEAQYNALPRGSEYIGPDGKRRRKQ
jgi:hypothetical protein